MMGMEQSFRVDVASRSCAIPTREENNDALDRFLKIRCGNQPKNIIRKVYRYMVSVAKRYRTLYFGVSGC